jgi:hypothetical protein
VATRKSSYQVRFAIQRFRYAATGRWAVSIRTYLLIVFPFGYLTSIERELALNDVSISKAASIAISGELACALYIFITQAVLLKNRRIELQPIWRCALVWVGAGFFRGFITTIYAGWGLDYDFVLANRLVPGITYTAATMSLVAFFFGSIERKRIEIKALNSLGNILEQEQSNLNQLELQNRSQAQQVLQTQLLPQIDSLQDGIKQLLVTADGDDSDRLAELYQQSLAVSNSLKSQKTLISSIPMTSTNKSDESNSYSYWNALLPKTISVRITFLLLILGSFSGQYSRNGIEGVKAGFIGAVVLTIFIFPLAQIIKRNMRGKSVAYPLAYLGAFTVQAIYNLMQPKIGLNLSNPYPPWYSGIKTTYGVYIASIIASMLVYVQGTFKDMVASGNKLRVNVDRLNQENLALEQSILESQFGSLQGKISGVTMALHMMGSMPSIDQKRKSELLAGANELLDEALRNLDSIRGSTI